jgi:hypothetical protein
VLREAAAGNDLILTSGGGSVGDGVFGWPTGGLHTISGNGYTAGHLAIDITANEGDPVYAADAGVVRAGAEALIELTGGRFGMRDDRAAVLRGQGVDIDARCVECVGAVPVLVRALHASGADAASVFCAARASRRSSSRTARLRAARRSLSRVARRAREFSRLLQTKSWRPSLQATPRGTRGAMPST